MPILATGNKAEHGFGFSQCSAEHGFTSLKRSAEHGFTLIELMVVIAVIGLMSAAVIFNLPDPRGRVIDEAERFAARAAAAREDAIMTARDVRVRVSPRGYGFDRLRRSKWTEITDKPLGAAHWADGTRAETAEIIFDSTGTTDTADRVVITRNGTSIHVRFDPGGMIFVGG